MSDTGRLAGGGDGGPPPPAPYSTALGQRVAFALSDATRRRVLQAIEEAPAPVPLSDLIAAAGTSAQAVRRHLAVLADAGLVVSEVEHRPTPGRPRHLYRSAGTGAAGAGSAPAAPRPLAAGAYERLAVLQAQARRARQPLRAVGRAEGRSLAGSVITTVASAAAAVDALVAVMAGIGFEPRRADGGAPGEVDLALDHCPFAAAADADPAGVCQLHLGIAEGVLQATGGAVVAGLDVDEGHRGGCHLRVRPAPRV